MSSRPPDPLLGVRATLILLMATLIALAGGFLEFRVAHSVAGAIITGALAWAGAIALFNKIIGR
jgi:hypothetical protein